MKIVKNEYDWSKIRLEEVVLLKWSGKINVKIKHIKLYYKFDYFLFIIFSLMYKKATGIPIKRFSLFLGFF